MAPRPCLNGAFRFRPCLARINSGMGRRARQQKEKERGRPADSPLIVNVLQLAIESDVNHLRSEIAKVRWAC
jgi:hypothetical protein